MHDAAIEVIVLARDHHLLHLVRQVVQVLQINPVVLDAHQLMNHRLVRPLVQQRSDWVLFPIADKDMGRGRVAGHSVDELTLLAQLALSLLSDVLAQGAVSLVSEDRAGASRHDDAEEPVNYAIGSDLVLLGPLTRRVHAQAQRAAHFQAEQVLVDGLEIGKYFLHLIDHVVHVVLGELLDLRVRHRVRKICHNFNNEHTCEPFLYHAKPRRRREKALEEEEEERISCDLQRL